MSAPTDTSPRPSAAASANALTDILVDALRALAAAGDNEAACRLAGQACARLRHDDPSGWQRFNALLHRLTKPR